MRALEEEREGVEDRQAELRQQIETLEERNQEILEREQIVDNKLHEIEVLHFFDFFVLQNPANV